MDPSTMRLWLWRILIGLGIAITAIVVIVQIVLWTPIPKRLIVSQLEQTLGLRISTASLSTGWFGHTELTGVSLGLPLSDRDFLTVKTLKIQHSSLIMLALGHVVVDSVEVDDPVVEVVQDPAGDWNVQQVAELLGRLGGSQTPQAQSSQAQSSQAPSSQAQSGSSGIPTLPIVKLMNGSVHITDNQSRSVALQPLNISGQPSGALVWKYDLTIGDSIALTGRVAPGGNWQHQITLDLHHLDPLVQGWGTTTTCAAVLKSHWDGQFSGGKLTGTLTIDQAGASKVPVLEDVTLGGSVGAEWSGSGLIIRPNQVELRTTNATLSNIGIEAGSILSDATGLHARGMKLKAFGGLANVDGSFDPQTSAVDLTANWSGLSLAKQTSQSGSLTARLRQPFAGQPVIAVDLTDSGTAGASNANRWNARMNLTGQGSSWSKIDWELTAPQLTYTTGGKGMDLSKLSAHINQHLPVVELTSMSLPSGSSAAGAGPASFSSSGRIDFASDKWNFDATGGFNTTFEDTPVPITVALHSSGTSNRYDLKSFSLGLADLTFNIDGSYDTGLPTPVDLHVVLTQTPRIAPDSPIQGEVNGEFKIVGDLFKDHKDRRFRPYLTTTGDLRSSDLVVFNRPIGDIDVKLQGITSTPNLPGGDPGPAITRIRTSDLYLFQAPWDLSVDYPDGFGNLEASLETHRLSLDELAKFAKVSGIRGQLVSARCDAVVPSLHLGDLDLHSEYHLSAVTAGGVSFDTVDAQVTLKDGVLKVAPLLAKNVTGTITSNASIDLQNARHLVVDTTVDRWPYMLSPSVTAVVSAHNNLDVDLRARELGANGTLTATADLLLGATTKLAHADLGAGITNRAIEVDKLAGNILSGSFNGVGQLDLNKPLAATGQVFWKDVDGAAIATAFPYLDGLAGQSSGTITLAPARDPRPLEPVRLDLNVATTHARFRSMQIGDGGLLTARAVGYLNTDRAVLDHSDIYLAGGVVHAWSRVDLRPGASIADQTAIDIENFQLDQLAHIDPKLVGPVPGILNGRINIVRSGTLASQVLGQAHFFLSQSNLGNFGPISALYDAMHFGGGGNTGTGTIDLAFEQNKLRITDFHYFNQGLEARGLCTVGPLKYSDPGKTPLDGQVVGTLRPLKDTPLPFLADFDQIFSAFAGGLTTVNILNTVEDPKYHEGLISDIGKGLRQLLVGEAAPNAQE